MLLRPGSPPVDRARRARDDRSLRVVRVLGTVFGGLWGAAILAGVLGASDAGALLAAQGKLVFLAALVAMFAVRGAGSVEDRLAWWLFAAATASYFAGALAYELYYRHLPAAPRP